MIEYRGIWLTTTIITARHAVYRVPQCSRQTDGYDYEYSAQSADMHLSSYIEIIIIVVPAVHHGVNGLYILAEINTPSAGPVFLYNSTTSAPGVTNFGTIIETSVLS